MAELTRTFISIFNFFLLALFLYLILKPLARQFFFARREDVRKRVVSSAWRLKKAQFNLKEEKERYDALPDDVLSRRRAIEDLNRKECDDLIAAANEHRFHILENARRMARLERLKASDLIKRRLLLDTFRRAEEKLAEGIDESSKKEFMNRGFADMMSDIEIWKRKQMEMGFDGESREGGH